MASKTTSNQEKNTAKKNPEQPPLAPQMKQEGMLELTDTDLEKVEGGMGNSSISLDNIMKTKHDTAKN